MNLTTAVEYAATKNVIISDRALRGAIADGRLLADWTGSSYVTDRERMDMFLLRRRRKNTRTTT